MCVDCITQRGCSDAQHRGYQRYRRNRAHEIGWCDTLSGDRSRAVSSQLNWRSDWLDHKTQGHNVKAPCPTRAEYPTGLQLPVILFPGLLPDDFLRIRQGGKQSIADSIDHFRKNIFKTHLKNWKCLYFLERWGRPNYENLVMTATKNKSGWKTDLRDKLVTWKGKGNVCNVTLMSNEGGHFIACFCVPNDNINFA